MLTAINHIPYQLNSWKKSALHHAKYAAATKNTANPLFTSQTASWSLVDYQVTHTVDSVWREILSLSREGNARNFKANHKKVVSANLVGRTLVTLSKYT